MRWCGELGTDPIQHQGLRAAFLRMLLKKGEENKHLLNGDFCISISSVSNQLQFTPFVLPALADLWETLKTKENSFDFVQVPA